MIDKISEFLLNPLHLKLKTFLNLPNSVRKISVVTFLAKQQQEKPIAQRPLLIVPTDICRWHLDFLYALVDDDALRLQFDVEPLESSPNFVSFVDVRVHSLVESFFLNLHFLCRVDLVEKDVLGLMSHLHYQKIRSICVAI